MFCMLPCTLLVAIAIDEMNSYGRVINLMKKFIFYSTVFFGIEMDQSFMKREIQTIEVGSL